MDDQRFDQLVRQLGRGTSRRGALKILGAGVAGAFGGGLALRKDAAAQGQEKVQLCHQTGSASNPYVIIEVAKNSAEERRHLRHGDTVYNGCCVASDCTATNECGTNGVCTNGSCTYTDDDNLCSGCQSCDATVCVDDNSLCTDGGDCGTNGVCTDGNCSYTDDDALCSGCQSCDATVCVDDNSLCTDGGDCGTNGVCTDGNCSYTDDDALCSGCQSCDATVCVDDNSLCTDGGDCGTNGVCTDGNCSYTDDDTLCDACETCEATFCTPVTDPCCGSTDPCCGSTDPCCGVICGEGFHCDGGDCVPDGNACTSAKDCPGEGKCCCFNSRSEKGTCSDISGCNNGTFLMCLAV